MEAIIFIGIQGVGKTTFYTQRFLESHVRVSLDMLKTHARVSQLINACLRAQQPFVVDNTNVRCSQRAELITAAKTSGFRVIGCYFPCPLREAIRRNLQRAPGWIPPAGVASTHKRLEVPSLSEGFDELHVITMENGSFTIVPVPTDKTVEVPGGTTMCGEQPARESDSVNPGGR